MRLVNVICCLSLFATYCTSELLIGLSSDYELLFPSGNGYQQAKQLFKLTSAITTQFNSTEYFNDGEKCLSAENADLCFHAMSDRYRGIAQLWQPKKQNTVPDGETEDPHTRRKRDCQYDIGNFAVIHSDPVATLFTYDIYQHSCESGTSIRGGASWEVFAVGNHALSSCSYIDNMDDTYRVTCSSPALSTALVDAPNACTNFTTVLMYEHFDGLSETIADWNSTYPPLQYAIIDNMQYCGEATKLELKRRSKDIMVQSLGLQIPQSVHWYSGLWIKTNTLIGATNVLEQEPQLLSTSTTTELNPHYLFNAMSASAAFVYHSHHQGQPTFSIPSNVTIETVTELARRSPFTTGYKYTFQPLILVLEHQLASERNDTKMKQYVQNRLNTIDENSFLRNAENTPQTSENRHLYTKNSPYENVEWDAQTQYHFVGVSHMRYLFDSIVEYFCGLDVFNGVNRHHKDIKFANFQYNFMHNTYSQFEYFDNFCTKLELEKNSGSNITHTLLFQTGAWDLFEASVRRVLEDTRVGKRLLGIVSSILKGQRPCGNIKHVIWLTSPPYPICLDNNFQECNAKRFFRVNSQISVVNQFYLKHLLLTASEIENDRKRSGFSTIPRLGVLDFYNIVKPRLVFNESGEVVCTNHYSCRIVDKGNRFYAEGHEGVLVQSPGGMAVVKLLLDVLFHLGGSI